MLGFITDPNYLLVGAEFSTSNNSSLSPEAVIRRGRDGENLRA